MEEIRLNADPKGDIDDDDNQVADNLSQANWSGEGV